MFLNYLPFFSFLMSFAGLILMILGIIQIVAIRREFSMYFDKRDEVVPDSAHQRKRKLIVNSIIVIAGIILLILSYFV